MSKKYVYYRNNPSLGIINCDSIIDINIWTFDFLFLSMHIDTLQMFTGWLKGFSAIFAGKTLQYLQFAGKSLHVLQGFPPDIAGKPLNHPVNPCKHVQCVVV